jgi:MFS transporter, CP family, cyanate transporter
MTKEGSTTAIPGHSPPSRVRGVLLVLGILVLAANLRPALMGLTPLIGQIRADTDISYGVAGLLTALPLLAMGVLSRLRR